MGYKTYSNLYHKCVVLVSDYSAGVWGFNNYNKFDAVPNRAIQCFIGTHKYATNLAINRDMGWVTSNDMRKIEMIRLWNRLIVMNENRLTKKIFLSEDNKKVNKWITDIHSIMINCDIITSFNNTQIYDLQAVKKAVNDQ